MSLHKKMKIKFLDFEKTSEEKIKKWQWQQVKKLLWRANRTPFYRKFLKKSKIIEITKIKNFQDFAKIPPTTENDLRSRSRDFLFYPLSKVWRIFATSATTGEPKIIFREPLEKRREVISVWYHLFKRMDYWPKLVGIMRPAGGLAASGPVTAKIMEIFKIPYFAISPEVNMQIVANTLTTLKPDTLVISPSFAALIVYQLKKMAFPLKKLGLRLIISTGEALHLNERNYLKKELKAEIVNTYGAADPSVWLASECKYHNGLHIFPYTSYLEFEPLKKDNKKYSLIVTPFANHAMSLLRYKLDDVVMIDKEKCACGRTLPRIVSVERKEKSLLLEVDKYHLTLPIRKIMNEIAAALPSISSFFNFHYLTKERKIIILFEVDFYNLKPAKHKKIISSIKQLFLQKNHAFEELVKQKKLTLETNLVPIGTLNRQAAKLKNQVLIK